MMTYGWAILIIVIVAAVLYSLGIFNPSASVTATVTGFSGFSVSAACIPGGALELQATNGLGYAVNITKVNTTGSNGQPVSISLSLLILPGRSQLVFVPGACTTTSGSRFSNPVTIAYTEPGQVFPGPYTSSGMITGMSGAFRPVTVAESNSGDGYIMILRALPRLDQVTVIGWISNGPPISGKGGDSLAMGDIYDGSYSSIEIDTNGAMNWVSNGSHVPSNTNPCNAQGNAEIGSLSYQKWYMLVQTINANGNVEDYAYLSGNSTPQTATCSFGQAVYVPTSVWCIGSWDCDTALYPLLGNISDIQVYNTSLSSTQIQTIYNEGIGGAPLPDMNLVGWWPLDGNANDYSGNNNNGVASNINWVSP